MRALLLMPDGVSVRNFLLTDLPDLLAEEGEVSALYGPAHPAGELPPGITNHLEMIDYPERAGEAIVRRTLGLSHIRCWMTDAMRFNLSRFSTKGAWRHRAIMNLASVSSRVFGRPRGVQLLTGVHDAIAARRPEVARYQALLDHLGVDVLLCGNQRPMSIIPVVLAARRLGIPTATFIFSWDNLTTKERVAVPFDHYFVWSELMADEMARFYPEVDRSRVHVVGSPQFEPYADEELVEDRRHFLTRIGADPSRPVICFSGGDHGTCPEDPEHLRILLEAIADGRIEGRPQVVVRPAPVDDGARYAAVRDAHPEIVWAPPRWVRPEGTSWNGATPSLDDVRVLSNLVRHADLNVNMASTMTLDFALHDVPVVNLGFDVADPPLFGGPIADIYYRWDHYRPIVELGAAGLARSPEQLVDLVNAYLRDPKIDGDGRRHLVDLELDVTPGDSTAAIRDALVRIARPSPAGRAGR
jgi:hypothetical protein